MSSNSSSLSSKMSESTLDSSASALAKKTKLVILEEEDDEDADQGRLAMPPLDKIDKHTLRTCCGIKGGKNPPFRCPKVGCKLSGSSGCHLSRCVSHIEKHSEIEYRKMLALHLGQSWDEEVELNKPAANLLIIW